MIIMTSGIVCGHACMMAMCGSRKYPYPHPPMEGQWKFLGGGGVKDRNFQEVWVVGHVKNFQEA